MKNKNNPGIDVVAAVAIIAGVALFVFWLVGEMAEADGPQIGKPASTCVSKWGQSPPVNAPSHKRWVRKLRGGDEIPRWAKRKQRHQVKCAKNNKHRKAIRNYWQRMKKTIKPPLPANHDLWVRIGRCEQPGSGYMGVNWSHPGPTYQGGLGMWYGNWTSLKPAGYPSNAGAATWRQQMTVANKLANIYGFSAWGCY